MYIERTHYYAKPGRADDVRATRLRACDVREAIGLSRGVILHKVDPDEDGPDVVWQCEFATLADHDRDLAARADSAGFEAVRCHMRTCYDKFERHFQEIVAG